MYELPTHPPIPPVQFVFALYAGLVFLVVAGLIFAPAVHRLMHKFHWQQDR